MLNLPFKPYSNSSYGMQGSMMDLLPNWGGGLQGSGQVSLALNTFNGNFFIKTTPLLIEDLGGPIDLSYCFNSLTPSTRPKWHLACLSQIIEQNLSSFKMIEADGSEVEYKEKDSIFYAPKNSSYAGASCKIKNKIFEWINPNSGEKRKYSSSGYLLNTTDAKGHCLTYTYGSYFSGWPLECITSSSGNEYHFTWKSVNNCEVTLKTPQNNTKQLLTSFTFSDNNQQQLEKVEINKGRDSYAVSFNYHNHSLVSISQKDGTNLSLNLNEFGYFKELRVGEKDRTYSLSDRNGAYAPREGEKAVTLLLNASSEATPQIGVEFIHAEPSGRYKNISIINSEKNEILNKFVWSNDVYTKRTRQDGSYSFFTYDSYGRIKKIEEYSANETRLSCKSFNYNEQGILVSTSDLLIQEGVELEETTHFIYDFKSNDTRELTFVVHPGGNVEYFSYDDTTKLLKNHYQYFTVFDETLVTLETLLEWQTNLTPIKKQRALLSSFKSNERGQVIEENQYQELLKGGEPNTKKEIYQQTFTKTITGALLTHKSSNSMNEIIEEVYERDAIERITSHKTPLQEETKASFTLLEEVTILPNGLKVIDKYNDAHQLKSRLYPNGSQELRSYTASGKLSYLKTHQGLSKHYFYNNQDELIYELNGAGELISYTNDHLNNVFSKTHFATRFETGLIDFFEIKSFAETQVDEPNNRIHKQIKDSLGQIRFELEKCDNNGNVTVTEYKYNSLGDKVETIAYANSLSSGDVKNLVSSKSFPKNKISESDRYSCNIFEHGKCTAKIDAVGYVTLNSYNGAGLMNKSTLINQPLSKVNLATLAFSPNISMLNNLMDSEAKQQDAQTLFYYNAAGKLTLEVDPLGYVTAYEYNLSGNKKSQRRYAMALSQVNFSVDIAPTLPKENDEDEYITFEYDLNGRCKKEAHINDKYEVLKEYDALGNVTLEVKQEIGASCNGDTYRASSTKYNDMGEKVEGINPIVMLEIKKINDSGLDKDDKNAQINAIKATHIEVLDRNINGLVTVSYNALGEETHYFYGEQNRLSYSLSPAGVITFYHYNAFGELTGKDISTGFTSLSLIEKLLGDFDTVEAIRQHLCDVNGDSLNFIKEQIFYNQQGLVSRKVDADGYSHIWEYNAFKESKLEQQEIEKISANKSVFLNTSYMREARGLIIKALTKRSDSIEAKEENKKYDNPLGLCTYSKKSDAAAYYENYDLLGRSLNRSIDDIDISTGEVKQVTLERKKWDGLSRMTEHCLTVDGEKTLDTTYSHIRKQRYLFETQAGMSQATQTNIFGEITSHTNAKGFMIQQSHNPLGEVSTKSDVWPKSKIKMRLVKEFDMAGRVQNEQIDNDLKRVFTRNKDGAVIKKESKSVFDHKTRVDDYKVNALGQTLRHINAEGEICDYQYSDGGQLELSVIDPSVLNIQTKVTYNGLKQKILESLSDGSDHPSYDTKFTQDNLARSQAKIIDPKGLDLKTSVIRNKADHIIQKTDGNGNKSYRILDLRGNPVLTISAMGVVKESKYNHLNQVTYLRAYKNRLTAEQIETFLNDEVIKHCNKTQNYQSLFDALKELSSIDDKQIVTTYNQLGKKSKVAKHFYDHTNQLHKAYVHEYFYSKTQKLLSQRSHKSPVTINNLDTFKEFNSKGLITKSIQRQADGPSAKLTHFSYFGKDNIPLEEHQERDLLSHEQAYFKNNFCVTDLNNKLSSLTGNNKDDRQTFYFYDAADRQTFIINPTGAITENIFNDKGQIIHVIEYAQLLDDKISKALKNGNIDLNNADELIRESIDKKNSQNLHTYHVFDEYKNPIFTVDSKGLVTRYFYDLTNKKTKTIHFSKPFYLHEILDINAIDKALYDQYSLDTVTDKDRIYQDAYDKAGRLIKEIDPNNNSDIYERNCADLIISHTDRAGKKTTNEYDLAKRKIAENLPEAPITQVLVDTNEQDANLIYQTTHRSVRNTQQFDRTDKVVSKTNDKGFDERTVGINYDLDGRYTGTASNNIEVDDKRKSPSSLFDFPIETKRLTTLVVNHVSNKPMVEKNESDAYSFKIYDGLDRLLYEVNAVGLVTFYERDEFGSPLKSTQFAKALTFSEEEFSTFIKQGISARYLDKKVQDLTTADDRIKKYTYSNEGLLQETITGQRHYFEPTSGSFYQAEGLVKQNYDAFGRVIERLTLMDGKPNEKWHKHYFWYDRGQRHPSIEAESFKRSVNEGDDLFKMTLTIYDVFGDPTFKREYEKPLSFDKLRSEYPYSQIKDLLKNNTDLKDRTYQYEFNFEDKEVQVKLVDRTHQKVNANSDIIDVKDLQDDPRKDIELECTYAARGERVVTTNAKGDKQWAFIDAKGLTLATVEVATVTGIDAAGNDILAYPLTYFFHNAHGEEVGSKQFWYGAEPTSLSNPYQLPKALKEALEQDYLSLELKDSRGLTKLKQQGTKQTAFAYNATKQKAREFISRLSDINSNDKRVIDEKRHTFNLSDQPILEEAYRDGKRIDNHSTSSKLNTWDECESRAFLNAPESKDITKWSQGHAWFTHQGKDLPTLQFKNMVDDITLSVTAHEEVLSSFNHEAEAIDFVKHNLYNNRVLKDIKTYDFAHNAIKHERPATKILGPNKFPIYLRYERSKNSLASIRWLASVANHIPFIRITDKNNVSQLADRDLISGLSKVQKKNEYYELSFKGAENESYSSEIFYFKANDLNEFGYPSIDSTPIYARQNDFRLYEKQLYLPKQDDIQTLDIDIRWKSLGKSPNNSKNVIISLNFWDKLPVAFTNVKHKFEGGPYLKDKAVISNCLPGKNYAELDIDFYYFISFISGQTSQSLIFDDGSEIALTNLGKSNQGTPTSGSGQFNHKYLKYIPIDNSSFQQETIVKVSKKVIKPSWVVSVDDGSGIAFDQGGLQGEVSVLVKDSCIPAKGGVPVYQDINKPPVRTNRVTYSEHDRYRNNTSFINENRAQWLQTYNAYNDVLDQMDPPINSMVAPNDPCQGDLTYTAQTTQKILKNGYDINRNCIGFSEGFINVASQSIAMKPAGRIKRAPNGQLVKEIDSSGTVTNQTFYSGMKLPISVQSDGLSNPFEIKYQGINVDEMIFHSANVGTYMSNTTLAYKKLYDVKTNELIGVGVPSASYYLGNTHNVTTFRLDDLGQINARKLPGGQVTSFEKDFYGNNLIVHSPLLKTTYTRHPFSGNIQTMKSGGSNGNWVYKSNRLNLPIRKEQLSRDISFNNKLVLERSTDGKTINVVAKEIIPIEKIDINYNAELMSNTYSQMHNCSCFYSHDDADNVLSLSKGDYKVFADYNAMNHLVMQKSKGKFTQRYRVDPYYNQVLSELDINVESNQNIRLCLANSFNFANKILRNGVEATWVSNGFLAHMPGVRQGGINSYNSFGTLEKETFLNRALRYQCDSMARLSDVTYLENGTAILDKHLLYDISGYANYVLWHSTVVDNRHPILPWYGTPTPRDLIFNQDRLGFIYDANFSRIQYHDSLRSIVENRKTVLSDGITVSKTLVQDNSPNWHLDTLYYYECTQEYKFSSSSNPLALTYNSTTQSQSDFIWGDIAKNNVYYVGDLVSDYKTKEYAYVSNLLESNNASKIVRVLMEPIASNIMVPSLGYFNNRINYQFLTGVNAEFIGRLVTTDLSPTCSTTINSYQKFIGQRYNGEEIVRSAVAPYQYIAKCPEDNKGIVIMEDLKNNDNFTASYKTESGSFSTPNNTVYDNSVTIADPINNLSVLQAAITAPAWLPIETKVNINDPLFDDLPSYQKAMLPFIADKRGNLPSSMLLALSKQKKQMLKINSSLMNLDLENQKVFNIGSPASQPYHEKDKDEFLEVFVTVLVSVAIAAMAPAAASIMFSLAEGATASAAQIGIVTALMDAGLKGSAYKAHLISHYALLDSVGAGLSAGLGQAFGMNAVAGKGMMHLDIEKVGSILSYAISNNLSSQLIAVAEHKQNGFKIESLLASITTALTRQMVGARPENMGSFIGNSTVATVKVMSEIMVVDFMGAAICGQDVNMRAAVIAALTNAAANSLLAKDESHSASMMPAEKKEKLKGAKNLPPNSKKSSQKTHSSQKRYNEKQHQQAILAAYGHCSVANDGSYQLSGEEFIQDFWKDSCYDFDSEHGVVSADHHEHALLSPNQKKTTPNSGGQSKTATWQTQAAAVQKAKATALPSVGSSKYGLFSKPSEQQAMFDAADYLAHESVAKSSSISDYTNEIYKFAVGVEDMFFHPLQTAQHVADASVHAAKDIYASRNESARDIITRGVFKHILWQQTATGAEKFGLALNIAASEATFGVARMGVLGRSGKYVPNGGLSGYIERTSKLDYSPISTVAEADFGYLNKAALTKAQAAVVRRVESAISKHAKPHDFLGVEKELAGIRIPKSSGGYFNHVQEMRNTITHLDKQMISIENSLKNPILDSTSRQVLSQAHELARQTVSRMSNSLTSDLGVSIKPLGTRP